MRIAYYSANKLGKSEWARRQIVALRAAGHEVVVVPPSDHVQGEIATFVSYDESWVYREFFEPSSEGS